jgi:hypothetical protein
MVIIIKVQFNRNVKIATIFHKKREMKMNSVPFLFLKIMKF